MSARDDGGPAFPRNYASDGHNGLSLRDYFAAQMLTIIPPALAYNMKPSEPAAAYSARVAYIFADAMLKARAA